MSRDDGSMNLDQMPYTGFFADQFTNPLTHPYQRYSVARDFCGVSFPFNEKLALVSRILRNYALHYQTGEQIPTRKLIDKIKKIGHFNQGYVPLENLAASNWISMAYPHWTDTANKANAMPLKRKPYTKTIIGMWFRRRSPTLQIYLFCHIFGPVAMPAATIPILWEQKCCTTMPTIGLKAHGGLN